VANTLVDVQATFLSVDSQYGVLLSACKTPDQRTSLGSQYAAARQNYQNTLNASLEDDDAEVAALSAQLKAANAAVVRATVQMGDIAKVIDDVTSAVTLGAQLVAKAAAL
jgi:hypothetical protein